MGFKDIETTATLFRWNFFHKGSKLRPIAPAGILCCMRPYKITLFILALAQIVSNYFTSFSGQGEFTEPLIVPAGYTFAIWGVIILFCFIHATYHLFEKKTYSKVFYSTLSTAYLMFPLWLLAAERDMLPATVIIFIVMLLCLRRAFREVLEKADLKNRWNSIFLQGGIGIYLGWATIAVPINFAAMAMFYGLDNYSLYGQIFQGVIILLATANAVYALKIFNNNRILFGTFWWAFVGLLIGLVSKEGTLHLLMVAALSAVAFNMFYFKGVRLSL